MIARVQNTNRVLKVKGQTVQVWEGLSEKGTRFHLFVMGSQIMPGQTRAEVKSGKTVYVSRDAEYLTEMSDQKLPAAETAALPSSL